MAQATQQAESASSNAVCIPAFPAPTTIATPTFPPWNSVRAAEALRICEAVPLHAIPNGYAAYSQNVRSLGFVALRLGKRINELLSL